MYRSLYEKEPSREMAGFGKGIRYKMVKGVPYLV